jgi:hypothetical protein
MDDETQVTVATTPAGEGRRGNLGLILHSPLPIGCPPKHTRLSPKARQDLDALNDGPKLQVEAHEDLAPSGVYCAEAGG